MKFRSNIGTQPNASGLQQIPGRSAKIPQSFLNGIGRAIDRAVPRVGGTSIFFQQTSGGTIFEIPDTQANTSIQGQYLHPFKVTYVGRVAGGYLVNILEGRVTGRADYTYAGLMNYPVPRGEGFVPVSVPGYGTPGLDLSFAGGFPGGYVKPDLGNTDNTAGSPQSQTTSSQGNSGSTGHSPSNAGRPYVSGSAGSLNGPYVSGNAGSITNPGNGGTYHTPIVSGAAGSLNGPYVSGNAGSLNPGFGGGTYHSPLPINGNQTWIGVNNGATSVDFTVNQGNTSLIPKPSF